jgi:hypothetical protein
MTTFQPGDRVRAVVRPDGAPHEFGTVKFYRASSGLYGVQWDGEREPALVPAAFVTAADPGESPIQPGDTVRYVLGEDAREDYGTVSSIQDGGYGVTWTGDVTPKFAAADEVERVEDYQVPETFTRV